MIDELQRALYAAFGAIPSVGQIKPVFDPKLANCDQAVRMARRYLSAEELAEPERALDVCRNAIRYLEVRAQMSADGRTELPDGWAFPNEVFSQVGSAIGAAKEALDRVMASVLTAN